MTKMSERLKWSTRAPFVTPHLMTAKDIATKRLEALSGWLVYRKLSRRSTACTVAEISRYQFHDTNNRPYRRRDISSRSSRTQTIGRRREFPDTKKDRKIQRSE